MKNNNQGLRWIIPIIIGACIFFFYGNNNEGSLKNLDMRSNDIGSSVAPNPIEFDANNIVAEVECEYKGSVYEIPDNAMCVHDDPYNARLCNYGYYESGLQCLPRYNGYVVYKNNSYFKRSGSHEFSVDNVNGGSSAIVKLVPVGWKKAVYSVFIENGSSANIANIPNGSYEVYFKFIDQNRRGVGSQKADDIFSFQTTVEGNYYYSQVWEITLYKTKNGNLSTDYVSGTEFDNL